MNEIVRDNGNGDVVKIKEMEDCFGVKFPSSYRDLILRHDSPKFKMDCFDFENKLANKYQWPYKIEGGVDCRDLNFLSLKGGVYEASTMSYFSDFYEENEKYLVPFGVTASGDYICFDYRQDSVSVNPPVSLVFHDVYDEGGKRLVCHVARSFDDLMGKLRE